MSEGHDWTPEAIHDYLVGSLVFSAADWRQEGAGRASRALVWYRRLVAAGRPAIPFCIVHDLGWLLLETDAFPFRSLRGIDDRGDADHDADLRELRLLYEGRLCNALLGDPSFRRASFAVAQAAEPDEPLVRAIELLTAPLAPVRPLQDGVGGERERATFAPAGWPPLNPALLRETVVRGALDEAACLERFDELLGGERGSFELVRRAVQAILERQARSGLVASEDLAELEHWRVFARASQRLLFRRIAGVSRRIGPFDARGFREREEPEQVETELPDEGYYPEGGISELTCRGSIESLVPSELIYIDERTGGDDGPADLFTVRMLENELLYYMRETGQLRRRRRTVAIVIDASAETRLRPPGAPDNLAVLAYGLAQRLEVDLRSLFAASSLRIHIVVVSSDATERGRVEEDRDLLERTFSDEVAHGLATVDCPAEVDLGVYEERGRSLVAVAIGTPASPILARLAADEEGPTCFPVELIPGDAAPGARDDDDPERRGTRARIDRDADAELADARDAVLRFLTGADRPTRRGARTPR